VKSYIIPDTMYNAEILLVVNGKKDEMLLAVEKHFKVGRQEVNINYDCAGGVFSVNNPNGSNSYVIWLLNWNGGLKAITDLVHECNHFVNWLLNDRGIKFHLDSDDVQCYYLGHIFGNCLATLKHKAKGKK
jgi:hypothetical protein